MLVGGVPHPLDAAGLLDAFVAHRRGTLARRGDAAIDARIDADLARWLVRGTPLGGSS